MTSSDQNQGGRAQDEVLAGEYVLGVLPMDARRLVESRIATDRRFAKLVERWETDLASFNDDYEEVAPPSRVFGQVEKRLFGSVQAKSPAANIWNSVAFWRGLSLGASAIAAVAVVYASGVLPSRQRSAPMVAELSSSDSRLNMLASYDGSSGRLRIVPVAASQPEKKSLELWLVPGSGSPKSLGVFDADQNGEMVIPADMRSNLSEGAILAVSVEPFGGSPTGLPTGPVIASGSTRKL